MPLDGTLYEDETLRDLRAAQERIRDPKNWCQGSLTGSNGQVCAAGAILVATDTLHIDAPDCWTPIAREILDLLDRASKEAGFTCAVDLNDESDHQGVHAMFDRARGLRTAAIDSAALARAKAA